MGRRLILTLASVLALAGAAAAQCDECQCSLDPTPGRRNWVRLEYLLWWIEGDRVPLPLLTTGSTFDPRPGALDSPNTSVLFGDDALDYHLKSGFRLNLGRWLDPDQAIGFEIAGFMLETHTIHGRGEADRVTGEPVIARPFINAQTGLPDAFVITAPRDVPAPGVPTNFNTGGIDIFADSRLWGGEANAILNWLQGACLRIDWLAGFRYLGLKDELRFSGASEQRSAGQIFFQGQPINQPAILSFLDMYMTHNHFYGGQVGGQVGWQRGRWRLDGSLKLGLGCTHQELNIRGETLLTVNPVNPPAPGFVLAAPGGHFAQPSNIGFTERNEFSFLTELGLRAGCDVFPRLRLELGYDFLYWSSLVRPGAVLNPLIDPRQAPGRPEYDPANATANPVHIWPARDFWAQGLTAGLLLHY